MAPAPVDLKAVRRQLEYYFSDSNLPRDKFLRAKTEENEAGFVPIQVLLTFKRLQALGASISHIADAVKSSQLLALDDKSTSIRRVTPLPEQSLFNTRALYAKGWPAGGPEPTIDDLITLFEPSGKVLSVRIRRWVDDKGKHFKGSIFIEMESPEAVERVVAEGYSITVKDETDNDVEKDLILLPFDEYMQKKKDERRDRIRKYKVRVDKKDSGKQENGEANGEKKTEEQRTAKNVHGDAKGADGVVPEAKGVAEAVVKEREVKQGLVLKFEGFGPDVSREDIKEVFEPYGEVSWVDFRRGDSEGYIRFAEADMVVAARDAMAESKTEFGGKLPTFSILEGEEEDVYWKEVWIKKDMAIENNKKRRRESGGRGGRGKRFRGRGRGRGGPRR